MNKIGLSASIVIALTATSVSAANYSVDGRGDAMGGTGVVSADFLTAPFYNPALAALYRRNDNAGMILPGIGLTYTDQGDMVKTIGEAADVGSDPVKAQEVLDKLDKGELSFDIGAVAAFAIPNSFVSMNVFGKAYTESYVTANIATGGTPDLDLANSNTQILSAGITELGMTFAKYYTVFGQHMSFGVSPKIQRVYTLLDQKSFDDFNFSSIFDSLSGETSFNMDAGAVWFYGPYRVGFSAMNIMSREIETNTIGTSSYKYQLTPNYTIGAGLVGDYFALSVDYDLVEREKFVGVNDNEQMLRVGIEGDIMRQMQLRAGYYTNLARADDDGTITAGIGLSPLNIITLDIGASYTNKDSMGVYINFLSNY
ncbi:conjugal transfer protein TraF [Vibrio tapetis subsp. quintayensis]|uniref:conjugal transfer protein TraF n=1 Tax=Vibrio tapetis TaxID=52443 RepID=UPI0025B3DA42|nr:conjugal transfer protein TraF [Vibrio tapetis]MDN3680706.1 conjugal transfer protein TraF [Vibrio tapetis subsp. quintayensis]